MTMMMLLDNARALDRVEQAERETPRCDCGRVTVPAGRRDGVWLECASLGEPRSLLSRILTLDFVASHTRRRIVDLVEPDRPRCCDERMAGSRSSARTDQRTPGCTG